MLRARAPSSFGGQSYHVCDPRRVDDEPSRTPEYGVRYGWIMRWGFIYIILSFKLITLVFFVCSCIHHILHYIILRTELCSYIYIILQLRTIWKMNIKIPKSMILCYILTLKDNSDKKMMLAKKIIIIAMVRGHRFFI